jgi:hypothetical protein
LRALSYVFVACFVTSAFVPHAFAHGAEGLKSSNQKQDKKDPSEKRRQGPTRNTLTLTLANPNSYPKLIPNPTPLIKKPSRNFTNARSSFRGICESAPPSRKRQETKRTKDKDKDKGKTMKQDKIQGKTKAETNDKGQRQRQDNN